MNDWLPFAVLLAFGSILLPTVIALSLRHRARGFRELEIAARNLGLAYEPHTFFAPARATGTYRGLRVIIDGVTQRGQLGVEVTTGVRRHVDAPGPMVSGSRVSTGDATFDAAVVVFAEDRRADTEAWALSAFDAAARERVRALIRAGGEHDEGRWVCPFRLGTSATTIQAQVDELVDAAAIVARPPDPTALRDRAKGDPVPAVRENAFRVLVDTLSSRRDTDLSLLRELDAEAPNPKARLRVARLRGRDGRDVVREVFASNAATVDAALAFEVVADPSEAEEALLAVLRERDVRVVDALARVGTVRSVPHLTSLLVTDSVGDAARSAIRMIQSRVVGAERGSIALADPVDVGGLSEAADAGRLAEAARRARGANETR